MNKHGPFDVIIHNAGIWDKPYKKTADGLATTFAVNTLAPYILTCLIAKPKRLIIVSSGMHRAGDSSLRDLTWTERGPKSWSGQQAYCDTKFHNVLLAFAFARKWPDVASNALDPGWVPTKLGGAAATDDIQVSIATYSILAEGTGDAADVTGKYFANAKVEVPKEEVKDVKIQERLLEELEKISGVSLPSDS